MSTTPYNVLTRSGGNGSLEVRWTAPDVGVVDHYDVYCCKTLTGTYVKMNRSPIKDTWFVIRNLVFGLTIFTKVRAVLVGGAETGFSQVGRDAIANLGGGQFTFRAPVGDVFPAGIIITGYVNGQLCGFKTLNAATIGA